MMNPMERIFFLKKIPLFSRLAVTDLMQVAQVAEEVTFHPGEYVFRQGDVGDALYVLVDGDVSILLDQREINRMVGGQSLGEIAILENSPRTAGVRAYTDVYALKISQQAFDELSMHHGELRLAIVRELASRLFSIRRRREGLEWRLSCVVDKRREKK